ncbi:MAG: type II secretion system F family protein [Candidatus Dormibacteraceae bacterium]
MREVLFKTGAVAAGLICAGGVVAVANNRLVVEISRSIATHRVSIATRLVEARPGRWLSTGIERAGWNESPERVTIMALAFALCLAAGGWAVAPLLAPLGFIAGCAGLLLSLNSAIERRRRRLAGELVPLLELFTLELSGGGSALAALGSVSVQVEGELASDLRRMLIASQVGGSTSFEARLLEYSDRTQISALASLAILLAASREYGTGTSQGVRALAADLRRAQRRDLITHSRRALNRVLLPAAIGVLLPFLGVLMFPAVSVLQRSLR